MNSDHVLSLCLRMFQGVSRPVCKTVAAAATALLSCQVVGVSALGRRLEGNAQPNSGVRRIERLIKNPRVRLPAACGGLVRELIRPHRRTYVCMDWTDQGAFQRLDISVVTGSRSIPAFWKVVAKDAFSKLALSQNQVEEDFLREFVDLLPRKAEIVLLADRGFGRTSLLKVLGKLPLKFAIRIKGDAWIRTANGALRLKEQAVPPGQVWDLGLVSYKDIDAVEDVVKVRVVVAFGMAAEEPWRLVTNLDDEARQVAGAYARRFECEETFRDQKDLRFGFGLKLVRLSEAVRYERLLVVVAVACMMAFAVGARCEEIGLHRHFQVNTRKTRQHSLTALGCFFFNSIRMTVSGLIETLVGSVLSHVTAFDGAVDLQPPLTHRIRPPRRRPQPTPRPEATSQVETIPAKSRSLLASPIPPRKLSRLILQGVVRKDVEGGHEVVGGQ